MSIPHKLLWALLTVAVLATAAAAGVSLFRAPKPPEPAEPAEEPPVIGEWSLTERDGKPYGSKDLAGRVWIANFIFTNCAGPCPVMIQSMEEVIAKLPVETELRFVTFSVDPKRDTPEVLTAFAKQYKQDPRWKFVTGWEIYNLVYERFKLMARPAENPTPGNEVIHSTSFALIDQAGTMRGIYSYKVDWDDDGKVKKLGDPDRLVADARRLLREGPPKPAPPDPLEGKPAWVRFLPKLNTALNGLCFGLLGLGLLAIKKGKTGLHKALMMTALGVSVAFLASYLTFHAQVGSVRFRGTGWIRPVYFGVLISHTTLAAAIVPMALTTMVLAWKERWERHRALARWSLPLWMYVSVTGILVYTLLYGNVTG